MLLIIGWLYHHFQRNIICKKLVSVLQLLLSHYRFGTLVVFMVTTPAPRVSFGGDFSSLLATSWDLRGWCDAHDCIAHLLICLLHGMRLLFWCFMLYMWRKTKPVMGELYTSPCLVAKRARHVLLCFRSWDDWIREDNYMDGYRNSPGNTTLQNE